MNIYDAFVCHQLIVPRLLADLSLEWDDALKPYARDWLEAQDSGVAHVTAALEMLAEGDLTGVPDEVVWILWTLEHTPPRTKSARVRRLTRFTAREREVIIREVIKRAILLKLRQLT